MEFKYKPDGEVLKQFMKDDHFWRGIRGPVGSGKSVGCAVEIFRRALQQAPDSRGIRRSRWGVIRNTGPQLKTTTIKTWLDWFPEDEFGPFRWGVPFTHHIVVGDIDLEVIFLALDDESDVRKLLSLELTGIWANEAREMPKTIIDACTMRVGRYPSMRDGGPSWFGMICDTNAPEDDHWWAVMSGDAPMPEYITPEEALMLRKPPDWRFFTQPPGMREELDAEGRVKAYVLNEEAENRNNLVPDYYPKIIQGKDKTWIDVYVMNRLGTVLEGKPVYPTFKEETHKSEDELFVLPNRTLYVGLDFGFYPAAVFGQRLPFRQWHIIDEVCPEDVSLKEFAGLVHAKIADLKLPDGVDVKFYGDPSGSTRSSKRDDKKNTFQLLRAEGIQCLPAPTNDVTIRIEVVKEQLDRLVSGTPAFLVSPKCRVVMKGFRGGYCYRRIGKTNRYENEPLKNACSHPHDGLQYLLLGAGEGRRLLHRKSKDTDSKPRKAKTRWNPFSNGRRGRRKKTATL